MKNVDFKMRFDAASGLFSVELQPGTWSVPIELDRIERIVKQESIRRSVEGGEHPTALLSARIILAEALLNAPAVKKIPAKGNRAEAAKIESAELDEILGLLEEVQP